LRLLATHIVIIFKTPNYSVFFFIYFSRFLYLVKEHHTETRMTVENLALVFGPNILRPQVNTTQLLRNEFKFFYRENIVI